MQLLFCCHCQLIVCFSEEFLFGVSVAICTLYTIAFAAATALAVATFVSSLLLPVSTKVSITTCY